MIRGVLAAALVAVVAGCSDDTKTYEPSAVQTSFESQGIDLNRVRPLALSPATESEGPRYDRSLRLARAAFTNTEQEGPTLSEMKRQGWVTVYVFPREGDAVDYEDTLEWAKSQAPAAAREAIGVDFYRRGNVVAVVTRFHLIPGTTTPVESGDPRPQTKAALDAL